MHDAYDPAKYDLTDILRALSDPGRQSILALLRVRPRSTNELVEEFAVSRPAISKQMAILRRAGLAVQRREGRQQIHELSPEPLAEVREWIDHLSGRERPAAPPDEPAPTAPAAAEEEPREDWRCW